jgi:hypothetical protein
VQTRSFVAGVLTSVLAAAAAGAQGTVAPQCSTPIPVTTDACQKAIDLFNFMAPQLGTSITGGNAVLGSAGTLGGLGHFSIGVRANVLRGQLPQTDNVQLRITGAQRANFAPEEQALGLPTAEAAIGLFPGVNVGVTNVGGVDALVSAFYVPDVEEDPIAVRTTGGALKLGYGVRVGILQETSIVPGVSVSYLRRDLPTVDIRALIGTADSVRVTGLGAKTTAIRLAASKSIAIVGLTAGVGRDTYDSKANAGAYIAPRQIAPGISASFDGNVATVSQKLTRTNLFAGVSLNLSLLRIAGEIGRVSGGSVVDPFNSFGTRRADDAYNYASVGIRLSK